MKNKQTKEKMGKDSPFTKRLQELTMDRGLVTRIWDVMHLAPPLVVTREEIDEIVAIVDESITIAERENADLFTG